MATATTEPASAKLPIRRNIALLSAALAALGSAHGSAPGVVAGLRWNFSFVAATAELTERTDPSERASLLGFNDLVSAATGAGLTVLGGAALTAGGVAALDLETRR
jgi:hypothetical protein